MLLLTYFHYDKYLKGGVKNHNCCFFLFENLLCIITFKGYIYMWVTLDKGTEIMIFSGKNFYPKYYYVIQYMATIACLTC